jgi:ribosomal protein L37AE/L43A
MKKMAKCAYCGKKIPERELSKVNSCPSCSKKWVHGKLLQRYNISSYKKRKLGGMA